MTRVLAGRVIGEPKSWSFEDGLPDQLRVACELPGQTWDIQVTWFETAGYGVEEVRPGLKFKAETPAAEGMAPRSLSRILPKVIEEALADV